MNDVINVQPISRKKNNLELFGRVEDVELGLGLDGLLQGSEELLLEPEDLLDVAEQGAETKHKKKLIYKISLYFDFFPHLTHFSRA